MDQFVKQKQLEGGCAEEGSFTLSPERAREKLRDFQLADPHAYVLKIIQAAVRTGAGKVEVKISRDTLTISFESDDEELTDPATVAKALDQLFSLPKSALRHLAVGLHSRPEDTVRWETPLGVLELSGEAVELLPPDDAEQASLRFVVRKKRTLWQWFRGSLFIDESRLIETRCAFSPTRIVLDARPLPSRHPTCVESVPSTRALLQKSVEGQGGVRIARFHPARFQEQASPSGWVLQDPEDESCPVLLQDEPSGSDASIELSFSIFPLWDEAGRLIPVYDGVTLDPVETSLLDHPGVLALIEAGALTLDLSEFQVVEDEVFTTVAERIAGIVKQATESVRIQDLTTGLASTGLRGNALDKYSSEVLYWLHHHERHRPSDVTELLLRCFPPDSLHVAPSIPPKKLDRCLRIHAEHLLPGESILALYDDTILKSAKVAWCVTPHRLCWKDVMSSAKHLLWEHVQPGEISCEGNALALMGSEIPMALTPANVRRLANFLRRIHLLQLPPAIELPPAHADLISRSVARLGTRSGVHYHPYIPDKKLQIALPSYAPVLDADHPLVMYDDTLFGSADNGFVLTLEKLAWKGLMAECQARSWRDIDPEAVRVTSRGVGLNGAEILVSLADLREPASLLFADLAAAAAK